MNKIHIWSLDRAPHALGLTAPRLRYLQIACLVLAVIAALPAAFVSPDWVAAYLSPDGQLSAETILAIDAGRAISAALAIAILASAFHPHWIQAASAAALAGNRHVLPAILGAAFLAALLITSGYLIAGAADTSIGYLVRDPNAIAGLPFYYGALEYAGIILMAIAGGVAIFAGSLLKGASARFLICGGLLTLLLVCDDLYMLHESSAAFHLNERVTFGIYGACALLFAVTNLPALLKSPFILLGIAAMFFALALAVDGLPFLVSRLPIGGEDMLELIGICFWSFYFLKHSRDLLVGEAAARPSSHDLLAK